MAEAAIDALTTASIDSLTTAPSRFDSIIINQQWIGFWRFDSSSSKERQQHRNWTMWMMWWREERCHDATQQWCTATGWCGDWWREERRHIFRKERGCRMNECSKLNPMTAATNPHRLRGSLVSTSINLSTGPMWLCTSTQRFHLRIWLKFDKPLDYSETV